jgi:hypothetical protein
MAQVFGKSSNSIARVSLAGVVFGFFGFWGVVYAIYLSPYTTDVNVARVQQVPFSHQHHVSRLYSRPPKVLRRTWIFVAAGFIWLVIMIDLTHGDYLTRHMVK